MQRLAEFIVRRRVTIIVASIVLAAACALLIPAVNIEKDLTRYLPASSDTLQGLDAMAQEFGEVSPVRVMYDDAGLTGSGRDAVQADLAGLQGVSSVSVEEGAAGTAGEGKVLFTVNLEGGTYSQSAADGLAAVRAYAERTGALVSGTVVDVANQQASLAYTFGLALAVLLVILVVMCASWVEPLLFLAAIGVAVLFNLGTCVLLPNVSETTFSIAAVLQLALSMDYSIMLTDRYRQERAMEADPSRAMVRALRGGFTAIASSSLTTIAGMLCLVAMSFAIGRDMGVVLAKGVAFSLLAVLFVLPGLMVCCDAAVQRTRKPHPRPRMRGAARASWRGRYAVLGVFAVLAVASFVVKGSTSIGFFTETSNPDAATIDEAFPPEQQIVLLYDKDLGNASQVLGEVATLPGVDGLQSYETTLARQLGAADMAQELGMDEASVRALYYAYAHDGAAQGTMTVHDFATFVLDEADGDGLLSGQLGDASRAQLQQLADLTDPDQVSAPRTAAEAASLLGVDEAQATQLYAGYFLATGAPADAGVSGTALTLPEFVSFLQSDVLDNDLFKSAFTDETRTQITSLARLTDTASVTTPLDADAMASALGMDAAQVRQVYAYRQSLSGDATAAQDMTVQEFLDFMVTTVASSQQFSGALDQTRLAQIYQARLVVDASVAGTQFSATDLGEALGMDPSQVTQLLTYRAFVQGGSATWTASPAEVLAFAAGSAAATGASASSAAGSAPDAQDAASARLAAANALVQGALAGTAYDAQGMADLLAGTASVEEADGGTATLDAADVNLLYLVRESQDGADASQTLSLEEFVGYAAREFGEGGLFADAATDAVASQLADAQGQLADAKSQLVGATYARAIITTPYGRDSQEMHDLVVGIRQVMSPAGTAYHLVGDGPMGVEMQELFNREFDFITLLTAGTVFVIVALTFRSVLMPLLLVLLIQAAVNLTMGLAALQGTSMYYIALMVVQALLMGATIDYAILFTTCYREARETLLPRGAVAKAFPASIGTILTSGSILVFVLLAVGLTSSDVTTSEVCLALSRGALVAVLLVLVFLPGMLCALDRIVADPRALRPGEGKVDSLATSFGGAAGDAVVLGRPYAPAGEAASTPAPDRRAKEEGGGDDLRAWPELEDMGVRPAGRHSAPGNGSRGRGTGIGGRSPIGKHARR